MLISASLQAWGVVFPFAMLTSICRSIVTICSGLYLLIGMTRFSSKWILSHSTWYKFRRSRHQHGQRLPAGAIVGSKWTLATTHCAAIIAKTSATGTPLQDYTQSQICMGIKTGLT